MRRYEPLTAALEDVVPPDFEELDPEAYVPDDGSIGDLALRDEAQCERLEHWSRYAELFTELRNDPRINTQHLGAGFIHNGWYPTPDAEVYAAMLGDVRPRRVVEVGAGFSTAIARRTIETLGLDSELVVIDPQPRTEVADMADTVIRKRVEAAADDGELPVDAGTLLFVDSSHVVRAGGDVPLLFCGVIPRLAPGSVVHVHDVFLPFDYPPAYQRRLYAEQYVLFALLAGGERFQTEFATHYMARRHGDLMRERLGSEVGRRFFGASYWFSVRG
jgi:Methyltransferase domain